MAEREGNVRRLFPGGNTSKGFHSFYEYILRQERARRIFILKGGPGVGKSSFMKRVTEEITSRGYGVECHHCSSDPSSLDAVVVPVLGVALLDGTAPHVVDPIHPGAVDEIVDLGNFWDEEGLRARRDEIIARGREVGEQFRRAYRYLGAARPLYDDWRRLNARALDPGSCNERAELLTRQLLGIPEAAETPGKVRHLFGSAITPEGPKHHLATLFAPLNRRVVLTGPPGSGKSTLVKRLADAAVVTGFDVECLHCPFDPERIEHLVIPAVGVGVVSSTRPHYYEARPGDILVHIGSETGSDETEPSRRLFWELFDHAVAHLRRAKELHDELERLYVPHMDFDRVEALRERTVERILLYAREVEGASAG